MLPVVTRKFYKTPAIEICELVGDSIVASSGDIAIDPIFDEDIEIPLE